MKTELIVGMIHADYISGMAQNAPLLPVTSCQMAFSITKLAEVFGLEMGIVSLEADCQRQFVAAPKYFRPEGI